jgi:hypothetical protein
VAALVDLERDDRAVVGQCPSQVERRDADRGADLQHAPRLARQRQHVQQRARLRDDNGNALARGVSLHLG